MMAFFNVLFGLITVNLLFTSCNSHWMLHDSAAKNIFGIDSNVGSGIDDDSIDIDFKVDSALLLDENENEVLLEFGSGAGYSSGDDEDGSGSGVGDGEHDTTTVATNDPCAGIACQNGGLCLRESQNFRCQCPLGTFGDLCEENINVLYPKFYGHSYMYFKKPTSVNMYDAFQMTVKFKSVDRDGVLVFGSQMESPRGDFFSLELRDARVEFRFSLGLPEVKITSKIEVEMMKWHTVTINRENNVATMVIDGGDRLTAVAEGTYQKMSLNQMIYIGGHTVGAYHKNQGKGFTGCIEELKINDYIFDMRQQPLGDAIDGIDVGECTSGMCLEDACLNGGSCVVTSAMTYQCICQLGFVGVSCEIEIDLVVPSFEGYSYLAFDGLNKKHLTFFELSMIVKPHKDDGVLAYCAQSSNGKGDFLSLNLVGGYVEFRFDCGSGPAVLRSSEKLELNKWNSVGISRTGRDAVLMVNDVAEVKGMSLGGFSQTTFNTDLFIGGVPNYENVASKALLSVGFFGDIQRLKVDGFPVDLIQDALYGIGIVDANHHCNYQPCENNAECQADFDDHICHCHIGYYGENCENEHDTKIDVPMFNGMSYLSFNRDLISGTPYVRPQVFPKGLAYMKRLTGTHTELTLEFRTDASEGLMLWTGKAATSSSDFMGLGIQNGALTISYNLGSGVTTLTANSTVSDGKWHTLTVSRVDRRTTLTVDKKEIVKTLSKGSMSKLDTDNIMFIGGMNNIEAITGNRYHVGFKGCMRNVEFGGLSSPLSIQLVGGADSGRNIHHCT